MSPVKHSKHLSRVLFFKSSLGPCSAMGQKKRGQIGKISASEAIRGVSLADFFFCQRRFFSPFSHNAEPGPRLFKRYLGFVVRRCFLSQKEVF